AAHLRGGVSHDPGRAAAPAGSVSSIGLRKLLPVSASASDGAAGGNANCRGLVAKLPPCERNSPGRNAATAAAATVVEARWPAAASALRKAPTISPRTSADSRNRTSALAG